MSVSEPFGVYIHWPFCLSKCPYCDFNSHVRAAAIDQPRYAAAFEAEIASTAARIGARTVSTIFVGGGTPSLMQPATVAAVLDAIARHWTVAANAEITLEANPTSVEAERFVGFRAAGVNRVSLGVQALDDTALAGLGRRHTAAEALAAVRVAQSAFERSSFDLIYARPGQTLEAWEAELRAAIAEAAEHLSLYQLTIEQGTPFAALHASGKLTLPAPELARAFYDVTQEVCAAAGLPAYEVSNHARAGAQCRHNLIYWRYHEYAGIGPGAHGRIGVDGTRHATATEPRPEDWLERVESAGHGIIVDEMLSRAQMSDEFLLMGLRLTDGIDPCRYRALCGRPLDDARVAALARDGFVDQDRDGMVRVTRAGFPVLDAVIAQLAA
jgi:putative oxygen-independent coproporphyrinogen III oxidase